MKIRSSAGAILMMIAGAGAHPPSVASCGQLAALKLPDTTITRVEVVAGSFVPPPTAQGATEVRGRNGNPFESLPSFCRVIARVKPANDSDIGIEVWLLIANWNGKFQASGGAAGANSAISGSINFPAM